MYNFLDPKLSPKISSKAACMDNYEVSNLISSNFLVKSRGFLAYTSIKPPVELEIDLICSINVHYISLHTAVGTQKSTGLEILAGDCNGEFIKIAHASFMEDGVVFCNSKMYSKLHPPPSTDRYFMSFFKNDLFRVFTNCSKLKVRIFRTEKSVPCLAKVEVWGNVSKKCSNITMNTINHIMNKTNAVVKAAVDVELIESNFDIPEDFKDALTFDIMSLPMTLPSGHTVDKSSLEKLVSNDSAYGRQPCDPFTGVPFTAARKPVPNVALKTRIDMFLLQNAHQSELFHVKRTLGRKRTTSGDDRYNIKSSKYKCSEMSEASSPSSSDNSSLEDAIKRALNSDNFVRFTQKTATEECVSKKCCTLCGTEDNIYVIPCTHLFCRHCLIKICQTLSCSLCEKTFTKNQAERFHL